MQIDPLAKALVETLLGRIERRHPDVKHLTRRFRRSISATTATATLKAQSDASIPSDVRYIVNEVAASYGLTAKHLLTRSRTQPVAWARQDAMLRLSEEMDLSLTAIGRHFQRDHTTVLWGIRQAKERRARIAA